MRLIDADEAVKAVHDEFDECLVWDESGEATANEFENIILQMPTVDPVKHGHWRERDFGLICSECNHYTETMYDEPFNNEFGKGWALKRPYYCGYCGARMDEVKDETC